MIIFLWLWSVLIYLITAFVIALRTKLTGTSRIYYFSIVSFIGSVIAYTLSYLSGSYLLTQVDIAPKGIDFDLTEFIKTSSLPLLLLFVGGFFLMYFAAVIRKLFIGSTKKKK